ncbi:glutathione hydrolase 1-like [Andrographis paniculata]|uniref:glutathione hydrolase 1-like n=1 Tax=Andrographis paniculata TaxID=175694 RepID=UPI0021E79075|nr:glutathione hydrolase 1-like [Andrographis paniculata]
MLMQSSSIFLWLFVILSPCFDRSSATAAAAGDRMPASIVARHGVVAADHGLCSTIGRDVLKEGGHAVDAAVATAFCLGVVNPASSGIGGGAFMLVHSSHRNTTEAYDMRETAPLRASKNMYAGNRTLKASGALSAAVPGEVIGLELAWKKYGRMPWARLVRPSVKIAQDGFPVSRYLHMQMTASESGILADKGLRHVFTSNGSLLKPGTLCRNIKLSETLKIISNSGAKAFYNGSIGLGLIKDIAEAGGILTREDLASYTVKVREAIVVDVMGVKIFGMPPPSSGGAALALMLNMLEQYRDLSSISDPLMAHRKIESLKTAFALRMNLGDPDFVDIEDVLKDMLSKSFAKRMKMLINDKTTFNSSHYGGRWNQLYDHGTSHLSIVDKDRNAVSMTSTINAYFGSKFLSPSTGIIVNNEMDDFSIPTTNISTSEPPPAPPNFIAAGKRPLSSMTPTIIFKDGKLKGVVGASGGALIIAGTTQVLLGHLVRGKDPLSSVLAPRLYHQLVPNVVQYENWTVPSGDVFEVGAEIRESLKRKGHIVQGYGGGTICQFVVQQLTGPNAGQLIGVSDPRKAGFPAGF